MAVYQIRVKGHLEGHWSEWFDGLVISNLKNDEAVLCGEIVDQAALHGVLIKVRDARTFARAVPPGDEPAGSIRGWRCAQWLDQAVRLRGRRGHYGGEVCPSVPRPWLIARCTRQGQRFTGQSHEVRLARCGPKGARYGQPCRTNTRTTLIPL
jgi:hypothetical protein